MDSLNENVVTEEAKNISFKSLGVGDELCEGCEKLKWRTPTTIQQKAIPVALQGRDIIGLAETGSGKTAAFAIPILQALLQRPQRIFALILTPTRELAFQINEHFKALGASIGGIRTAVIVGGIDMKAQSYSLSKKPHIIIATPGRIIDHLENTEGFSLQALKFLVMDEADRMLDMDFEKEIDKILKSIPQERYTYLYSATMTQKVEKLERASLTEPVKIEVSKKYQTVEKLKQYCLSLPFEFKDVYLTNILNDLPGNSIIVFCTTCVNAKRIAFFLSNLGFPAIPLHGKLSQTKRLEALQKFKNEKGSILIATDVASRGLDIPNVDVVINFDVPSHPKEYIHRVGRTARTGCDGISITFVTQLDSQKYENIKNLIEKDIPVYPPACDVISYHEEVMILWDRVKEAQLLDNKVQIKDTTTGKSLPIKRKAEDLATEKVPPLKSKLKEIKEDDDIEKSKCVKLNFKQKKNRKKSKKYKKKKKLKKK